jgi:hypothetical protein
MLECLWTPPLLSAVLKETFNAWENVQAIGEGPDVEVGLPPRELFATALLMLACPRTASSAPL